MHTASSLVVMRHSHASEVIYAPRSLPSRSKCVYGKSPSRSCANTMMIRNSILSVSQYDPHMINPEAKLADNIFDKPAMASTREGFGKGSVEVGKEDARVVVLTADLAESTQAHHFEKAFPERFVQVGVAEQNLATVAAGMANYGKIPFITSYATFSPGRNWEQIRTTIAINNVPAIVCGMHAGISVGPDGATHQALEDIALMRALPRFTVISAC